jgi:hypothetical protein
MLGIAQVLTLIHVCAKYQVRMIVLLHAYNKSFSAMEVATMFTLYETVHDPYTPKMHPSAPERTSLKRFGMRVGWVQGPG